MTTYPYLLCRTGIYYFRRSKPKDLRYFAGQREIIKSPATTDVRLAREAVLEMSEKLDELFSKIINGNVLLSAHATKAIAADFTQTKTEKLVLAVLEDFKERSKEHEEWRTVVTGECRELKPTIKNPAPRYCKYSLDNLTLARASIL